MTSLTSVGNVLTVVKYHGPTVYTNLSVLI